MNKTITGTKLQIYRWNRQGLPISLFFFWIWSCRSLRCFFLSRSLLPWRSIPSCSWRRCMEGGGVVSRSGGMVARWNGYGNGDGVGGVGNGVKNRISDGRKLLLISDCNDFIGFLRCLGCLRMDQIEVGYRAYLRNSLGVCNFSNRRTRFWS